MRLLPSARSLRRAALTAALVVGAAGPLPGQTPAPQPPAPVSAATPIHLESYRSQRRVLVAYLPAGDAASGTFRQRWGDVAAGLRERDAVLLEITDLATQPEVARRLRFHEGRFGFALIGKDGHVAFETAEPVGPGAVYDRIDAMPMRRQEMRARGRAAGGGEDEKHGS